MCSFLGRLLALLSWTAPLTAQYNEDLAIEYARLAGAAYCDPDSLRDWSCGQCRANVTSVRVCTATTFDATQAYVGRWDGRCVVSFEGTETLLSCLTNLEIYLEEPAEMGQGCENCSVHAGYLKTWKQGLKPCIYQMLDDIGCGARSGLELGVTGHSLGAGVSAIAMLDFRRSGWEIAESYNFGMPRTGDPNFAAHFSSTFAGRFWRVTHHTDPIVQLPPDVWPAVQNFSWNYEHVSPEVFYDDDLKHGYVLCPVAEDMKCAEQYWSMFSWDWSGADHLRYMDVPLGIAGCEVRDVIQV